MTAKTRLTLSLSALAAAVAVALPLSLTGSAPARHQALTSFEEPAPAAHPSPAAQPTTVPQAVPAKPVVYTVKAGDTLSGIAPLFQTSWQALAGWNHLTWVQAQVILIGQVLKLPPAGYQPPALAVPAPAPTVVTAPQRSYVSHTSFSAGSGFEACVIARESGGNAQVMNSSGHYGLYQFAYSTWVANGGAPGDFGHASPSEQHAVFARSAPSNWQPYDGC